MDTETDVPTRRMSCGGAGRIWADASTSQEKPKMASKPPKQGEASNMFSLIASD